MFAHLVKGFNASVAGYDLMADSNLTFVVRFWICSSIEVGPRVASDRQAKGGGCLGLNPFQSRPSEC